MKNNVYLVGVNETNWKDEIADSLMYFDDTKVFSFHSIFPNYDKTLGIITDHDTFSLIKRVIKSVNVVFVNYMDILKNPKSIIELTIAYNNNIPILAINESGENVDPWIHEMCDKEFFAREDAVEFYINYIRKTL